MNDNNKDPILVDARPTRNNSGWSLKVRLAS